MFLKRKWRLAYMFITQSFLNGWTFSAKGCVKGHFEGRIIPIFTNCILEKVNLIWVKCIFMPYIEKEDTVGTFIIACLSNSMKRLLRNRKTGVLSLTDVPPNTVALCIGRRASTSDARMSYSTCGQNLSSQVKCWRLDLNIYARNVKANETKEQC